MCLIVSGGGGVLDENQNNQNNQKQKLNQIKSIVMLNTCNKCLIKRYVKIISRNFVLIPSLNLNIIVFIF